ncbi:hypothetical protein [Streptomyces sp. MI02-7b]|uniref:hypothetical protein n=1 Tax=Streptomyces sp. MI02-7b TaxID=462941 RepID=UPI0029B62380|nr:hypothetical protein [Streptomyces sp. MI02-7b]MDX3075602.1 hypothetical protein [Streptomyces sp. MI02-7b]
MNLDFSAEPLFSWYVVLLMVSGIAMIVIGAVNSGGLSRGWRAFNVLAGLAFTGYGIYLGFIFHGGEYVIFFKAFLLPVFMVINFFRALAARTRVPAAPQQMTAPPAPAAHDAAGTVPAPVTAPVASPAQQA